MVGALGGVEHWKGGSIGRVEALGGWEYWEGGSTGSIGRVGTMEGVEFYSQGHFHTLQVLNVPQFLFCRAVRLKTAPRGNFSHT